jgi:hypothetical protein
LIDVHRTSGDTNAVGSTIRCPVVPRWLSCGIVLGQAIGNRYLGYCVRDGFAQGRLLVFEVEPEGEGLCLPVYLPHLPLSLRAAAP